MTPVTASVGEVKATNGDIRRLMALLRFPTRVKDDLVAFPPTSYVLVVNWRAYDATTSRRTLQ